MSECIRLFEKKTIEIYQCLSCNALCGRLCSFCHLFLFLILHRIVPLETTLYHTTLYDTTLHYTKHYTALHYTKHYATLHYTMLCYTVLHYTTPPLTSPYRTVQPVLPTGCIYLKKVLSPLFSVSFRVSPTDHVLNKCEVDERMADILLWHKVR